MVDVSDMETGGVAMMEDDCGRSEDGGRGATRRLMERLQDLCHPSTPVPI